MSFRFSNLVIILPILLLGSGISFASTVTDTSFINKLNNESLHLLTNNSDSAKKLAERAIALSEKINYLQGLGDGYTRLGVIEKNRGNFNDAISLIKKSLLYRQQIGNQQGIGKCYTNLGNTFNRKGDFDSALYYQLAALRIFESISDSFNLNLCINNIGLVYQHQKDFSEAEKYFNRSLSISKVSNDSTNIVRALVNLGSLYVDMKNYTDATHYLKMAITPAGNLKLYSDLAVAYNNLALVYEANKNYDSALIFFFKKVAIDSILHKKGEISVALGNIGFVYLNQEQFSNAIRYLEKSIQLSIETGDKKLTATNYKNLAEAHKGAGDLAAALDDLKNFQTYNDSIFNEAKATAVTEMQTKYETEKKVQQINLLSEQNKVQRLQKNIFLAGVIALFAGALGLFIFFRQKQQIARRSDQIQKQQISELLNTQEIKSLNAMMEGQEKERKRIAADLHDRIGSSLSAMKLHFTGFARSSNISQTQTEFVKVNSMFDEVVKEVRQVSHDLASGVLMKFGLVSALKDLSESIESASTMKVNFYTLGIDERLDHRTEISLYRITQELISNILKHAQAREINIHLNRHESHISLMVDDNGVGFDPAKASGGIGMKNIRSRVSHLHGNVFFDSSPGRGCTVTIEIPITKS